jgi:hypothetical protein
VAVITSGLFGLQREPEKFAEGAKQRGKYPVQQTFWGWYYWLTGKSIDSPERMRSAPGDPS